MFYIFLVVKRLYFMLEKFIFMKCSSLSNVFFYDSQDPYLPKCAKYDFCQEKSHSDLVCDPSFFMETVLSKSSPVNLQQNA